MKWSFDRLKAKQGLGIKKVYILSGLQSGLKALFPWKL